MTHDTQGPALKLVDGPGGPLLYDVNRVKTYACGPGEAVLMRSAGADPGAAPAPLPATTGSELDQARVRLARLSRLSAQLAETDTVDTAGNGPPSNLFMHICRGCNLACAYCYAEGCKVQPGAAWMSEQTARRAIDLLFASAAPGNQRIVTFAGGEPLLHFGLIRTAVAHAERRRRETGAGLALRLLTNGTIMDREMLDFIVRHEIFVQVSLDGPPEVHDALRPTRRGDGSADRILTTLRQFKRRGYHGFRVRATLCHGNCDVARIERFYRDLGLTEFSVQPSQCADGEALRMDAEDLAHIAAHYAGVAGAAIARPGDAVDDLPPDLLPPLHRLRLGIKTKHFCGAGRDLLVVTPDGDLYPCPALAGDARFCIGDLDAGVHIDVGHPFRNQRVERKRGCRNCWLRNLCGGGCVAQALRVNGDPELPDPQDCAMARARLGAALAIHHHTVGRVNALPLTCAP